LRRHICKNFASFAIIENHFMVGEHLDMDESLRRYILRDIDDASRTSIEERLMVDAPFSERLMCEFDELADDYVHGFLPAQESERFESVFLSSPELCHKVIIAKALKRYVSTNAGSLAVGHAGMSTSNIAKLTFWLHSLRSWRTKGAVAVPPTL
jgi:hypothetical protein